MPHTGRRYTAYRREAIWAEKRVVPHQALTLEEWRRQNEPRRRETPRGGQLEPEPESTDHPPTEPARSGGARFVCPYDDLLDLEVGGPGVSSAAVDFSAAGSG